MIKTVLFFHILDDGRSGKNLGVGQKKGPIFIEPLFIFDSDVRIWSAKGGLFFIGNAVEFRAAEFDGLAF